MQITCNKSRAFVEGLVGHTKLLSPN